MASNNDEWEWMFAPRAATQFEDLTAGQRGSPPL